MALTPEQIDRLIQQADGLAPKEGSIFRALVKLTEAEVHKQDTALIRKMQAALETCGNADGYIGTYRFYNGPSQFYNDKAVEEAITAARAWLDGKP